MEAAEAELRTAQAASEAAQARVKALEAARDVAKSDASVDGANGAYAVRAPISEVETMNIIRKGQIEGVGKGDTRGQVRFVSSLFSIAV